jgi:hypothetical protein
MAIYNIYLGTPYKQLGFAIDYSPVREFVERLFQAAIDRLPKGHQFDRARVQYTSQPPQLARGELLIYLVRSRSESLWLYQGRSRMKNQGLSDQRIAEWVHKQPMVDPGHSGYTIQIGSEWLSEVYLNKAATNPGWVAALIFHEAMHNASRSRMSHGAYGQLSESDPKRSTYDRESVRKDVEKMAEWIASSPPPQWTEGFTIYREFNP